MALTLARSRDTESFQGLLTNIAFHPNYDEVEKAISDTLLAHDELSTYRVSFDVWYVSEWCNKTQSMLSATARRFSNVGPILQHQHVAAQCESVSQKCWSPCPSPRVWHFWRIAATTTMVGSAIQKPTKCCTTIWQMVNTIGRLYLRSGLGCPEVSFAKRHANWVGRNGIYLR